MNCNPCCGCFPPITTYNPSTADNFPTILQQVEYLKALLKKYPSQQWFISTEKVTPETVTITTSSIVLHERALQESDFILATSNDDKATILLFQYVGASSSTLSVVEYVGVFSNQIEAQEALSLAQTNEQNITSAEARITSLEAEASLEVTITPASATSGTLTEEQYNTLITNDNCYIKLNEVVYTLSKNSATGVLIYTSKYISDNKTVKTITVTKSTKEWVMTEVGVGKIYKHYISFTGEFGTLISDGFITTSIYSSSSTPFEFNELYNYLMGTYIPAFGAVLSSDYQTEIGLPIDLSASNSKLYLDWFKFSVNDILRESVTSENCYIMDTVTEV